MIKRIGLWWQKAWLNAWGSFSLLFSYKFRFHYKYLVAQFTSVLALLPIEAHTYSNLHISLNRMIRFLFINCLILIFVIVAASANTSITTDQDALLALKAHITHGPTNFFAKNWNTSNPVCNWTGVACDARSHRVTALDISP